MTQRLLTSALLALLTSIAPACGDDGASTPDATTDTLVTDTAQTDTQVTDTALADSAAADTLVADTQVADTAEADVIANSWGFPIRWPAEHTVDCPEGPFAPDSLTQLDMDWLCTFAYGGHTGQAYLRATVTECLVTFGETPVFGDCAGWLALDGGAPVTVDVAGYDWGGNHHNDSLDFTWDGKRFTYYHSSFGFGWRKCQEMDCLQVRDSAGELLEDGCTKERTLPAVCRPIAADGTWGDFTDTFAPCLGDPNYR